ncbi:MAG: aminotransferase class V-fold PLP-dependent enzyme, partial [Firmicutes bacterium]|nr:aminotransferase class V-fold PLP-dependent enzyme [Bacillota bacterium]
AAVSVVIEDAEPQDVGLLMDQAFDIAVRAGLHCAPDAHTTLGTIGTGGTIRISPGYYNTEDDIAKCIDAVSQLAEA